MIIKSMGRKKSTGFKGQTVYATLVNYMLREEDTDIDIEHNLPYGVEREDIAEIFKENARYLHQRKGANLAYHEIISLPANELDKEQVKAALRDIGRMYLEERARDNLAVGVIHTEKEHLHLHLMISANKLYERNRVRLSKDEFLKIQESVSQKAAERYPELNIDNLYTPDNIKKNTHERIRTTRAEQEQAAQKTKTHTRERKPSRKVTLSAQLHALLAQHRDIVSLQQALGERGLRFYQRGQNMGVIDPEGKRHRFSTLGIQPHFEEWQRHQQAPTQKPQQERPQAHKQPEPEVNNQRDIQGDVRKRVDELNKAREQGKGREGEVER
jgi:hypothetical protein